VEKVCFSFSDFLCCILCVSNSVSNSTELLHVLGWNTPLWIVFTWTSSSVAIPNNQNWSSGTDIQDYFLGRNTKNFPQTFPSDYFLWELLRSHPFVDTTRFPPHFGNVVVPRRHYSKQTWSRIQWLRLSIALYSDFVYLHVTAPGWP